MAERIHLGRQSAGNADDLAQEEAERAEVGGVSLCSCVCVCVLVVVLCGGDAAVERERWATGVCVRVLPVFPGVAMWEAGSGGGGWGGVRGRLSGWFAGVCWGWVVASGCIWAQIVCVLGMCMGRRRRLAAPGMGAGSENHVSPPPLRLPGEPSNPSCAPHIPFLLEKPAKNVNNPFSTCRFWASPSTSPAPCWYWA